MNQECAICWELYGKEDTRLSSALADSRFANAFLLLSEHFAVIPSVGPLVLGHSLVVTRQHGSNVVAGLSQPELVELSRVCEESTEKLLFGEPGVRMLYFEHGSRCELRANLCSTAHGHLHQLPLREQNIAAVLKAAGGQEFEVASFRDLANIVGALPEYIVAFSSHPDLRGLRGIVMDASEAPSQYLRQIIGDEIGNPLWDWKKDANPHLLRQTIALGFKQMHTYWPEIR